MSATPLPSSIKALKTLLPSPSRVGVVSIPFDHSTLSADSVVVKVKAVGLNPTDWHYAIGDWRVPGKENVCGCDAAGDVVAVGANVKHIKVGSRVSGFVFGGSSATNGAFAEFVTFNHSVVFELPPGMTYEEGAAMPIPHMTAVQALYMRLKLSPPSSPTKDPKTILIWGGSTAVGHQAIQLAKASGYKVFTTASPARHEFLKSIGANSIKEGGGKVVTTLPASDETVNRRSDVEVDFTLVYTELGYALNFANQLDLPAMPADASSALNWVSTELPRVLEGWKDGKSPMLVGPQIRRCEGGLEKIVEGLETMKEGKYAAEKLVYVL
ncbi:hypothetical protein RQP46_006297 [Phenoliferia psychrophenolica]